MLVAQVTAISVDTAIDLIAAAVCALHLYYGMFYALSRKQLFDLLSDDIRLADLLVMNLDMP